MKIFGIADLHLSGDDSKPMDVFGKKWEGHWDSICRAWRENITEQDIVLIPGDISWANKLNEAMIDIRSIALLPGSKVLLRGNHDYWWNSLSKIRAVLPQRMHVIQNDALNIEGVTICGTRGWVCRGSQAFTSEDDKIYSREVLRLELSIQKAKQLGGTMIGMMHFPPFNERRESSGFTEQFEAAGVKHVLYGHLHGKSCADALDGELNGITYHLVSCDYLDFKPALISEV